MNKDFLDIIQRNITYIQKYFYDNLNTKHTYCSGSVIGYKRLDDNDDMSNNWLKIRKTKLDIDNVVKELKNKYKIIFIQNTEYLNHCKNMIEILFSYAKIRRHTSDNKYEEWFNFNHHISISHIVSTLISLMNADNITIPVNIKQYRYTDNETKIISKTKKNKTDNEDDDDEFFSSLMVGGGLLVGGLMIGAYLADMYNSNKNNNDNSIPYLAKKGDISDEIFKLISLELEEYPMYFYTSKNIHIILSNKRLIKIENQSIVNNIYLDQIKSTKHIKKSIFYFDKIEIIYKNGTVVQVGIYQDIPCAYFNNLLTIIIKNINDMKPLLYPMLSDSNFSYSDMVVQKPNTVKQNCNRCLDKINDISTKINCIHKDMCIQCISILNECPKCFIKYN